MIRWVEKGNILDDPSDVLVVAVNTVPGVMGRGQARAFRDRWPSLIGEHKRHCFVKNLDIGRVAYSYVDRPKPRPKDSRRQVGICYFATKRNWKEPSILEWIEMGLEDLVHATGLQNDKSFTELTRTRSVALPALGCGNGWLSFGNVQPMMSRYLEPIDYVDWTVYLPGAERT